MPSQLLGSLYALVAEGEAYLRADLLLITSPIVSGQRLDYIDLGQPNVAGYVPMRADRIEELFPDPQIVTGKAAVLVSRQFNLRNESIADVQLTGAVLVVWKDVGTPVVAAVAPTPLLWRSGMRLAGRFRVTSNIYTEP